MNIHSQEVKGCYYIICTRSSGGDEEFGCNMQKETFIFNFIFFLLRLTYLVPSSSCVPDTVWLNLSLISVPLLEATARVLLRMVAKIEGMQRPTTRTREIRDLINYRGFMILEVKH